MRNNPFNSLLRRYIVSRYEVANGVYSLTDQPGFKLAHGDPVFFDFRDFRYTHFGDLLFFVPLLICLSRNFQVVCLATGSHKAILEFLLPIANYKITLMEAPPWLVRVQGGGRGMVITTPYLLSRAIYPPDFTIIGLGLVSAPTHQPFPEFLANAFLRFAEVTEWPPEDISTLTAAWSQDIKKRIKHDAAKYDADLPEHCIWLAPYLGSGRFRDFLRTKQRALISAAIERSRGNGATIILAGGRNDPAIQIENANWLDMRGNDIVRMLCLAGSNKVSEGIGFDGFWMHIFDILGKRFDVLFRGRYTQFARDLHYDSVNISFLGSGARRYL